MLASISFVAVQVAIMFILYKSASWLEKTGAFRGQGGEDALGKSVQRLLRLVFLFVLSVPILMYLPAIATIPILCMYALSYTSLKELDGGFKVKNMHRFPIVRLIKSYFAVELVRTCKLDPSKQYIFAAHPHGILPVSTITAITTRMCNFDQLFPGVDMRLLIASMCFYIPIYREACMSIGAVDAARYVAKGILAKGMSLALVPGGATEALYASPEEDVFYIRKRRGFAKLALETGASLVPVIGFNENNLYMQASVHDNVWVMRCKRKFQSIFGVSLPIPVHVLPRRTKVVVVVGEPLDVKKVESPTNEQVHSLLETYMDRLQTMYAEHGPKYNLPPTKTLRLL